MDEGQRNIYLQDIPIQEAQQALWSALVNAGAGQPLSGERIPLRDALGRITAEPVWARLSNPHYHACAMDGYAVRAEDTHNATETAPITLNASQAIPVNTGAPLPPDKNAVIMIEYVQEVGQGAITITDPVPPWQHVRMLGEDMVATELVLPANHRIRPVDLGAIAGSGHHEVLVRRQPRVVIIPTGSELVSADTRPQTGQIIEYNSLVLSAQVQQAGAIPHTTPIVPDDADALRSALRDATAQSPDLILLLSGSSAGSRDFTAHIVRQMGELLVHGIAVRPGHPVIMGMVDAIPIIGVPGYPVSAALTGEIIVQGLIARWLGTSSPHESQPRIQAQITRKILSPIGDDDYVRVTLARVGDRLLATPLGRGAGVITSLVRADGLAHIPRFSEGVPMGATVDVMLYRNEDAIDRTLLTMGSHDPLLDLLAQHLTTQHAGYHLTSANVGSMGGLVALKRDEAHLATMHLLDPETGEYNIPYIQNQLRGQTVRVVTFAHREQGFLVQKGNPHNITTWDDLRRVRYINRQRGAGTRLLLDYELNQHGIAPEDVQGYDREEYTHLAVASAVLTGIGDCGLGVRSASRALGLDFVSMGWERYDFVIARAYWEHEGILRLLDTLRSDAFKHDLSHQAGYDTRETGVLQYEG